MVSLLIVSHSSEIAQGVRTFVAQVAEGTVIRAVGGTAEGAIGTDVDAIVAALQAIASPDGTLVLVDLMGAVIATETAVELADISTPVHISDAPLVEGAYFAALEAAAGATLADAEAAALQARDLIKVHR